MRGFASGVLGEEDSGVRAATVVVVAAVVVVVVVVVARGGRGWSRWRRAAESGRPQRLSPSFYRLQPRFGRCFLLIGSA